MFKNLIKRNFLLNLLFKWLKKQYILLYVKKNGIYFAEEDSALQSDLIPFFRGYCLWKDEGEPDIIFRIGKYKRDAFLFENKEIKKRYPKLKSTGFFQLLNPQEISANEELYITFGFSGKIQKNYSTGWLLNEKRKEKFIEAKNKKLNSISTILKCPSCASDQIMESSNLLKCDNCNTVYGSNKNHFNLLTSELKDRAVVKYTENISSNDYDPEAAKIIESLKDGLILDNGSGLRGHYYENVVNFEIVDYPTTDVIGIGEKLPFKDEVFDAAFSLNVLEHVKDPFQYVKELKRVVKKGGVIYAAAPFLQPYHGYPYHYFNMTSEGLRTLFEDTNIIKSGEVKMGHPIFGISWILNEYLNGLSGRQKRKFSHLKVKDLIKDPAGQLSASYTKNLSNQARNIISCVNFVVCKKN